MGVWHTIWVVPTIAVAATCRKERREYLHACVGMRACTGAHKRERAISFEGVLAGHDRGHFFGAGTCSVTPVHAATPGKSCPMLGPEAYTSVSEHTVKTHLV